MTRLRIKAPAKINLILRVLGKRPDGYHQLETLLAPIALYDRLEITQQSSGGIVVDCPDHPGLQGSANLAWQAAHRYQQERNWPRGVHIRLEKSIPIQAGLGGGSSDAAAVLLALQRLDPHPPPAQSLADMAATIGSDVPFFLNGGPGWATGRGEKVAFGFRLPSFWVLLALAPEGLATGQVFDQAKFPLTSPGDNASQKRPDRGVYSPCFQGLAQLAACLVNDLQATGVKLLPPIANVQARIRASGAMGAMMSGSGPTVFGLFPSREDAEKSLKTTQGDDKTGWTYQVARGISALDLASDVLIS